jgi:hypothetical protein
MRGAQVPDRNFYWLDPEFSGFSRTFLGKRFFEKLFPRLGSRDGSKSMGGLQE